MIRLNAGEEAQGMKLGKSEKSTARDMTQGPILRQLVLFALPLMLGNVFQMLYNTVDSIIVGNFVSKQALAAIGSTTMIVNMLVFCFAGFAIGAGVVIGQNFGARNMERLRDAIHTTMAATFVLSLLLTVLGVAGVKPMLVLMRTPEDVLVDVPTPRCICAFTSGAFRACSSTTWAAASCARWATQPGRCTS